MKIALNFDASWVRFWSILRSQTPPQKSGPRPPLFDLEIVRCSCYVAHRFKRLQEPPKRPQDPPKSASRGSKRPPRAPQEAPRGAQETPGVGQEGSKPCKIAPKGSNRTLSQRQLCKSMLQISQRSIKTKKLFTRGAVVNGRAGGGVPPWGRQ